MRSGRGELRERLRSRTVPAYSLGNNGGNLWTNQRIIAANAAISKEIPLKERTRLQLRLDLQNPFKWFNWGGPSTSLNVQNATTR